MEDIGETLNGNVVNPALSKLFTITAAPVELGEEKKDKYHSISAKLLRVMKRSRPKLETSVSFLCTRVQDPTEEDWGELRRALNFVKATKDDKMIMSTHNFPKLETWVDASYTVHDKNMREHTGGCMYFGWGIVHGKASKQKLNTKSSAESELIGVSEYIPYKIHLINLLIGQGRKMKKRVLYHENESSICMENNGQHSCTGNSRHNSVTNFFVKDRVDKGEFVIEHCPPKSMLVDYFAIPHTESSGYGLGTSGHASKLNSSSLIHSHR